MLGEKLMKLRRRNGMSQQDVATALSVSRQTISNWESDTSAPDIGKARDLAALYRISLEDLVDDELDVTVAVGGKDDCEDGEVDLHVLKSLEGMKCHPVLSPGFFMPGSPNSVEVLEVDTNWVRLTYKHQFKKGAFKELVDMGSIVGFRLVTSPNDEEALQREEIGHNGCKRMD